jgi:rubrerythrin
MGKEYTVQEALVLAIKAEKNSMDFYRKAASVAKNERARKVLELLASEEAEFGDLQSYIDSPADEKNPTYVKLIKGISDDIAEQRALELSLIEEKECIGQYTQLARGVVDPAVRTIFERVLKETQRHYDLIESEYAHIMGMVHETDQDIYVRE